MGHDVVHAAQPDLPGARSAIVGAYPDPPVRFRFEWRGGRVELLVPPTYLYGLAKDARVQAALTEVLSPECYRVVRTQLPVKRLAVRSGLAEYGKNNITYVAGMGGFHRLAVFYSDLPCERDTWQAPSMMAACKLCQAMSEDLSGERDHDGTCAAARRALHHLLEREGLADGLSGLDERGWAQCAGRLHALPARVPRELEGCRLDRRPPVVQ